MLRRRGFTLAESVVALVIVGGVLVAALQAVASTRTGRRQLEENRRGQMLADYLMTEILAQSFDRSTGLIGNLLEIGLDGILFRSRRTFDELDDYAGFSESPLHDKQGAVIEDTHGWQWEVEVAGVDPADLQAPAADSMQVKRITVRVFCRDRQTAEAVMLRTVAWGQVATVDD